MEIRLPRPGPSTARHPLEAVLFLRAIHATAHEGGSGRALSVLAALVMSFLTRFGDVLPEGCGFAIQSALVAATTASATISPRESRRVDTHRGVGGTEMRAG